MKIIFNDKEHTYDGLIDGKLEPLLNASTFKKQYTPEFNAFPAAAAMARKGGGDPKEILKSWNSKGKLARTYGTAMHLVLEVFIKHKVSIEDNYVKFFLQKYIELGIDAESESVEGCERLKLGGILDLVDETTIYDLKTGNFLKKAKGKLKAPFNFLPNNPLGQATLQLNYYRLFDGNEDKDMKVLYWNGEEFEVIEIEKIDLTLLEEEIEKYYEQTRT